MIDLQQKILDKAVPVTEAGCWIWTGAVRPGGYGNVGWRGKTLSAHRASYFAFNGIISKGFQVNHKCDVKCCVNPEHLYLGDQKQNMLDMDMRGRRVTSSRRRENNPMFGKRHSDHAKEKQSQAKIGKYVGSKHHRATITEDIARFVFSMKGVKTAKQLSLDAGVSFHVIRNIWSKKTWICIHG